MNRKLHTLCKTMFYCFVLLFSINASAHVPCAFDVKDYPPIEGKDCAYILHLYDANSNGWDGASLDVSVGEAWPATNYKVTVADGDCLIVPIYVNDGETIDFAYWNGAFETEHGLTLYDALGNIVKDVDGKDVDYYYADDGITIPSNAPIRVRVECPLNECAGENEDVTVRITMGDFPEEQSWEIHEGQASTTSQGTQIIGINAQAYVGLAPGFQLEYSVSLDLCSPYTFVAFDGANNGWNTGSFEVLIANTSYGSAISNPFDTHYGKSLIFSGSAFLDEVRREFTLPCAPVCEDIVVTAVNCEITNPALPILEAPICYPSCYHAQGCGLTFQHYVLPNGMSDLAIAGPLTPYTGTGSALFSATLSGGQHQVITEYNYCDGLTVRCTSDLIVASSGTTSLTCNDNVGISLGVPSSDLGQFTLGECLTKVEPDMVLEMPEICGGEYEIVIFNSNGLPIEVYGVNGYPLDRNGLEIIPGSTAAIAHDIVGPDQAGQTLSYTITHLGSNNACWGTISVEDKIAPVIECQDFEINCTHPFAMDETYQHTVVYSAADELPANIAGGSVGLTSNTFIPVNVPCTEYGEQILDIQVNLSLTHGNLSDLVVLLHAPSAFGFGTLPLATAGLVLDNNVWTTNAKSAPLLTAFVGEACTNATSTTPEYYITENSGGNYPSNVGNTWYIQITDTNATPNAFGGGEITAASISLTCGFPTPNAAYDCSIGTVELVNETIEETNCDQSDWIGAVIVRTWQASDTYGNRTTCVQNVSLKTPTLDEIEIPGDVTIECTGQTADQLTGADTGLPRFGCSDLTQELYGLCDVSYSYDDLVVPTCGLGFKVIRTWSVISWCTNVTKEYQQIIKVEDTEGPTITQEDITIGTSPYDCSATVSLSDILITDNCSGVNTVTATYAQAGGSYANPSAIIVDLTNGEDLVGLPVGEVEVLVSAADNCLNLTEKIIKITVEDTSPPLAICDDELHVSLGSDGTARLDAYDVDEGSYDNCSEVLLEVRRSDGGCTDKKEWDLYVGFECCDINEMITIELRATDAAGNSNVCWKTVIVEDALAPVITCPQDKTFDCNDPAIDSALGEAVALDNCTATVTYEDGGELDQCYAGVLTRTFTASDGSDKSADARCTQTITVNHVSDFVVQFPADVVSTSCMIEEAGEPAISSDDCELIAVSSEDQVLDIVPDACYNIERTWTIINWCIYDGSNQAKTDLGFPLPLDRTYRDDDGYFKYVQTIQVFDEVAPEIDCPVDATFCATTDNCEGEAKLVIAATDACTQDTDLEYFYSIDVNNDGSLDIVANGNDATGNYSMGTHRIVWTASDGCGNASTCEQLFTIEDCKNPTPVCLNGISIPNMVTDGCVDIWASDVLEYAFDNCSDAAFVEASAKMRLSGSNDPLSVGLTLCCENIGTVLVDVWVSDEAGNADFCTTYILLQDNSNYCEPDLSKATVAGSVHTAQGKSVEDVNVDIASSTMNEIQPTGITGQYAFSAVDMFANYMVQAEKDEDPLNGVSTYDLVLISQHVLGINEMDSPYTLIAADVNNDGNISTFDVVQLRQLILYVVTDFPSNNSWRFVDANYVFPNAQNPWMETFPEMIDLTNLAQDQLGADFVAVKIGDVDGNAITNNLLTGDERTTTGTLAFAIDDQVLTAGTTQTIEFRASDFNAINGYQFTLNFDNAAMTFADVEAGALAITSANIGTSLLSEGVLTASWNTSEAMNIKDDEVLFSLNFEVQTEAVLSDVIHINSRYTTAEAYTTTDLMDVAIAFVTTEGTVLSGGQFELYQNTPNPFSTATLISFNLPEAATATLKIYDVTGRILSTLTGDFERGYNEVNLDKASIDATGILYYELNTASHSATKKMLIVD